MKFKIIYLALALVLVFSMAAVVLPISPASAQDEVTFPDPVLREAIRDAIGGGDITQAKLDLLTSFSYGSWSPSDVTDLTGLEHCTSLQFLSLWDNQIGNISPLSSLTSLSSLFLWRNQISDISPLSSLTSLSSLDLHSNQIGNISPLSSLTSLAWLQLTNNQISDILPLSSLTSLTDLNLWANQISDISPLSSLTSLTDLNLDNNQISDIEALVDNAGLSAGDRVWVRCNPLSSTSIETYIPQLRDRTVEVLYDPCDTQFNSNWATTTPTIDGDIVSFFGEWSDATTVSVGAATVYVKNDGVNLYVAAIVPDTTYDPGSIGPPVTGDSFVMLFDEGSDGLVQGDGDGMTLNPGIFGPPNSNDYVDLFWDPAGSLMSPPLSPDTLLTDGSGNWSWDGANYYYEFSKPLNSGDSEDMAVSPGDTVGVGIAYQDVTGRTGYWWTCCSNSDDPATWGDLVLATTPNILTVNTVGSGSVTLDPAGGTYTFGQSVDLIAVADPGWAFSEWSGDLISTNNPDTIIMDGDKTVTATLTTTSPPPPINANLATTIPTIDGDLVTFADEWNDAATISVGAATVFIKNDWFNIYVAAIVPDTTNDIATIGPPG